MCEVGEALARIFTPKGTGGLEAKAKAASDAAVSAEQKAKADADQAAAGTQFTDAAKQAEEQRLRLLLAATGAGASFAGGPIGLPPVGTKALTGS